ncbi:MULTISPECIES: NAD(P)H-dependent glycerol-3-phosphate dehydrogenase [unclassified Roseitalea]|uniref:NAD(P)H-dependent glycerol-3-phosphate dehydrogenase n=1 Tax=unclassified Roseitalea TaxID=2639107 RepID=UPI00273F991A|nr:MULTISPECIES: NAD(P)H-dependent glycerol-3-phosphate dehydrogenase [unclassified Roseitalea]
MSVAVIGAGAWGTALAAAMARGAAPCTLWGRDGGVIAEVNARRRNTYYLGNIELPAAIGATTDAAEALAGAEHVLFAVPAQTLRAVLGEMAGRVPPGALLVSCAKGIERETGRTMTEVMGEIAPGHRHAVLSGPSFAADVSAGLPTAVTVAMDDLEAALAASRALSRPGLRCYASDDPVGVEQGGALKNVLAIAAGIVDGRRLGASALAALTTRGFAEMSRLAMALGARAETLSGLSGLGDLILTCASAQSRNFTYGRAIGRGEDPSGLKLAEGVPTAAIADRIARQHGIDAPIIATVAAILSGRLDVDIAIATLLARPIRPELRQG